jgi:Holliday junction resolvase-like predicted endonuclease
VSTATGRRAEAAAAVFLEYKGCQVVARNWRTRRCEIDIVATRAGVLYLCEVKYRAHDVYGRGLDYITPQKLTQMRFAARCYIAAAHWAGPVNICAIEISGPEFRITGAVTDL